MGPARAVMAAGAAHAAAAAAEKEAEAHGLAVQGRAEDLAKAVAAACQGLANDDAATVLAFAVATEMAGRLKGLEPRKRKAVLEYLAERTKQAVAVLETAEPAGQA